MVIRLLKIAKYTMNSDMVQYRKSFTKFPATNKIPQK